jgi:hypothetical protein
LDDEVVDFLIFSLMSGFINMITLLVFQMQQISCTYWVMGEGFSYFYFKNGNSYHNQQQGWGKKMV